MPPSPPKKSPQNIPLKNWGKHSVPKSVPQKSKKLNVYPNLADRKSVESKKMESNKSIENFKIQKSNSKFSNKNIFFKLLSHTISFTENFEKCCCVNSQTIVQTHLEKLQNKLQLEVTRKSIEVLMKLWVTKLWKYFHNVSWIMWKIMLELDFGIKRKTWKVFVNLKNWSQNFKFLLKVKLYHHQEILPQILPCKASCCKNYSKNLLQILPQNNAMKITEKLCFRFSREIMLWNSTKKYTSDPPPKSFCKNHPKIMPQTLP